MQKVLKELVQYCAYGRIERELLPEKTAANEHHDNVLQDNERKQNLIDHII